MDTNYVQLHPFQSPGLESDRKTNMTSRTDVTSIPNDDGRPLAANPPPKMAPMLRTVAWEVTSLLIAAASLAGLAILLANRKGKPTPTWSVGNHAVSLNAIVSIISTLFTACLLAPVTVSIGQFGWIWMSKRPRSLVDVCTFDSASRGPLGCFRLLYKLRFLHTASIAAFVVIASLSLGPVFQQLVRYNTQPTIDPINRSQALAAYNYNSQTEPQGEESNAYVNLPYNMKSAMYSGLLASNSFANANPPFTCTTGNCTWDPFGTLAVRTQCEDVSKLVSLNCTTSSEDGEVCSFVAPGDANLKAMLNGTIQWNPFVIEALPGKFMLPVIQPYETAGLLAGVQWVKALSNLGNEQGGFIQRNTTYEAMRCFFSIIVQEVQAKVDGGVYSEEVLQVYTEPDSTGGATPYTVNGTDYKFFDPFDLLGTPINASLTYKPPFAKSAPNLNETFSIALENMLMIISQLTVGGFLTGVISTGTGSGLEGDDIPSMLYEATNVTRAMFTMATSMTNALRSNDSTVLQVQAKNSSLIASNQAVLGSVLVQRQYVIIQWGWITVPIVLLVLATIVLAVEVFQTRTSGVGLWRNSPLTLFFNGKLGTESPMGMAGTEAIVTESAMQAAASRYKAKISQHYGTMIEISPHQKSAG